MFHIPFSENIPETAGNNYGFDSAAEYQDFCVKSAQGIRGRYGTDVWANWLAASAGRRIDWLASKGVRFPGAVALALCDVLAKEGIRAQNRF